MLEIMKTIWIKGEGYHTNLIVIKRHLIWWEPLHWNDAQGCLGLWSSSCRVQRIMVVRDGKTQQVSFSTPFQIGSAPCGISCSSLGSVLHNIMLYGLFIYLYTPVNRIARVTFYPPASAFKIRSFWVKLINSLLGSYHQKLNGVDSWGTLQLWFALQMRYKRFSLRAQWRIKGMKGKCITLHFWAAAVHLRCFKFFLLKALEQRFYTHNYSILWQIILPGRAG